MSIVRRPRACVLGAFSFVVLAGGCVTQEIDHGTGGNETVSVESAGATITGSVGSSGGFVFPEGNYPDPAVTRCGDVLGDAPAIPDLASAWAVVAVPNATAGLESVEAGALLLRLSQRVLVDCGSDPERHGVFFGTSTGGDFGDEPDRGLELMIAPEDVTLGVHPTSSVTLYGEGVPSELGTETTVELLRVDDDCIVGIVRGLRSESGAPFMEGGFVAQTCQRQCIPTPGFSC